MSWWLRHLPNPAKAIYDVRCLSPMFGSNIGVQTSQNLAFWSLVVNSDSTAFKSNFPAESGFEPIHNFKAGFRFIFLWPTGRPFFDSKPAARRKPWAPCPECCRRLNQQIPTPRCDSILKLVWLRYSAGRAGARSKSCDCFVLVVILLIPFGTPFS